MRSGSSRRQRHRPAGRRRRLSAQGASLECWACLLSPHGSYWDCNTVVHHHSACIQEAASVSAAARRRPPGASMHTGIGRWRQARRALALHNLHFVCIGYHLHEHHSPTLTATMLARCVCWAMSPHCRACGVPLRSSKAHVDCILRLQTGPSAAEHSGTPPFEGRKPSE